MFKLSPTSFLCGTITGSIYILITYLLLKKNILVKHYGHLLYIILLVIMFRFLVPVELPFTKTLLSHNVLPFIRDKLLVVIFTINGQTILFKDILFTIWIIGSLIYLLCFGKNYYSLHKIVSRAPEYNETQICSIVSDLLSENHISRSFKPGFSTSHDEVGI